MQRADAAADRTSVGVAEGGFEQRIADLYATHGAGAVRLAFLLTGDRALAEDIAHEAFVRLIGRWGQLRNPDSARAYLMRTVVNLVRKQYRRRATERRHAATFERSIDTVQPFDLEGHDELIAALQKIPPRQRAALVLRYCNDLSEREAAHLLGTSEKALKSLVTRGLAEMRKVAPARSDRSDDRAGTTRSW